MQGTYSCLARCGSGQRDFQANFGAQFLRFLSFPFLSAVQRRGLIAAQLKEMPDKSDRQLAEGLGVTNKTAGATRDHLESREEIPHVYHSVDKQGRKQPRKRKYQYVDESKEGEAAILSAASASGAFWQPLVVFSCVAMQPF